MSPQRIQRQRTKGWRMPEGAIYVGRPSRWGNPFRVEHHRDRPYEVWFRDRLTHHYSDILTDQYSSEEAAIMGAVHRFSAALQRDVFGLNRDRVRAELAGHDLVCWCPLDQPCHADVLLLLANVGQKLANPTGVPRVR